MPTPASPTPPSVVLLLCVLALGGLAGGTGGLAADAAPALEVRWRDAAPVAVVPPGDAEQAVLVVANRSAQALSATASLRLSDADGAATDLTRELAIAPGAELAVPLALHDRPRGICYLDYRIPTADGALAGRLSLLHAAPCGPAADAAGFLYGVHLGRAPDRLRAIAAAGLIGINTLRVDVGWLQRERVRGTWNWDQLDETIAACRQHGMQPEMLLAYGNPYAAQPTPAQEQQHAALLKTSLGQAEWLYVRVAQQDAAWREFVARTVARYHDRAQYWEVWNEPDLRGFFMGTVDDYLRMLRAAHDEIKRIAPNALVMTGGFATTYEPLDRINAGLQERVLAEAGDSFDIHAYHGHGDFASFSAVVDGSLQRMRANLKQAKPLYFNETAITAARIGERAQAEALVKKLVFSRARGAIGYTWYDLCNDGSDPGADEENYGLLTRDFQPKAVYAAYNELITRLRGARFSATLQLGDGAWGVVFQADDRQTIVTWKEDAAAPDAAIALQVDDAGAARAVDLMGNSRPVPGIGGTVLCPLSARPTYLVLPGCRTAPRVLGSLLRATTPGYAVAGQPCPVTITADNPLAVPLELALTWRAEPDASGACTLAVAPHGSASAAITVPCPADTSYARPFVVHLAHRSAAGSGALACPLAVCQRIPAAADPGRAPDFRLESYADVVNYFEADPATAHLTWHGPRDLAARFWLHHDDDGLTIHAEVDDDVHFQNGDANGSWKGDGLQLALRIPGQDGTWEFGVAVDDHGRQLTALWSRPAGFTTAASRISASGAARPGGMVYDLRLPYGDFGLTRAQAEDGLFFNAIVNDNDGDGRGGTAQGGSTGPAGGIRKGFMRIAPGIGESKDPKHFRRIRFDP